MHRIPYGSKMAMHVNLFVFILELDWFKQRADVFLAKGEFACGANPGFGCFHAQEDLPARIQALEFLNNMLKHFFSQRLVVAHFAGGAFKHFGAVDPAVHAKPFAH